MRRPINDLLRDVLTQTVDRELTLQEEIGPEILQRYGIKGDIQKINDDHNFQVRAFMDKPFELRDEGAVNMNNQHREHILFDLDWQMERYGRELDRIATENKALEEAITPLALRLQHGRRQEDELRKQLVHLSRDKMTLEVIFRHC